MHGSKFVAYVGPSSLHDGQVREVVQSEDKVTVHVEGGTGQHIRLMFSGVSELKAIEPVGMVLYALCEMSAELPMRRFVFSNWSEDDPARLEVVAEGIEAESYLPAV